MKPTRINLGSGYDYRPGWVNIEGNVDIRADIHVNLEEVHLPTMFHAQPVDEVLAQDILEHLLRPRALHLCRQVFEILKPGGLLTVRMPHTRLIVEAPVTLEQKITLLYGGQDISQTGDTQEKWLARKQHPEFFAHKYGWTPHTFGIELGKIGFVGCSHTTDWPNFTLTTYKPKK